MSGAAGARVLFLPKAGTSGASSRLRALQYVPFFEAAGFRVRVVTRPEPPAEGRFAAAAARHGPAYRLREWPRRARYFARLPAGLLWCDAVFLQRRALAPALVRGCRLAGRRIVYDFDDALFVSPDRRGPKGTAEFHAGLRAADAVIAGNEYLADYARKFCADVRVVPTGVPAPAEPPAPRPRRSGRFVLGWIGTATNIPFLRLLEAPLRELARDIPELVLKVISSEPVSLEGVRVENVAWRLESADRELAEADVGVMPLPDDPFTRGKCAYKALQCMALGLPVVASPVGMNREVLADGREGFLAAGDREWVAAVLRLYRDPQLAVRMGQAARARAREYSVERCAERLVAAFREVLAK